MLTRLTDADVPQSRQSLSDHLSLWLGWTDAIALSAALNTSPPVIAPGARMFSSAEERDCERVRTTLADAIASDTAATSAKRRGPGQAPAPAKQLAALAEADADYANFRQRYLSLQHTMETAVGNLRSRLRGMVAARNGEMTRLAVVDAIMDRALLPKERALFGAIPKLLQGHFQRLREAEAAALAQAETDTDAESEAGDTPAPAPASITPGAWLDTFRKDMRSVLLAELDVRLQPVEGLLATLRAS